MTSRSRCAAGSRGPTAADVPRVDCRDSSSIRTNSASTRSTATQVNSDGYPPSLHILYNWESSIGTKSNLAQCEIWEDVSYSPAQWPSPPFAGNPSGGQPAWMADGNFSSFTDNHTTQMPFATPLAEATVIGTQRFKYKCPCLNNGMALVDIGGPDAGPLEIERKVFENEFVSLMHFSIKKHGTTRVCQLDVLTGYCS